MNLFVRYTSSKVYPRELIEETENISDCISALTAKYVPDDILAECGVEAVATAESVTMQRVTMVAAVCSSVMAATVLVATLASICSAKRRTKQDELDFPSARWANIIGELYKCNSLISVIQIDYHL